MLYREKNTFYLFTGKCELDFKTRFNILFLDVDEAKVCVKQPKNVMENCCFVIHRTALKNSDDWLVTDLGSFDNCDLSARIFAIKDDKMVDAYACKGTLAERQKLQKDEFLVRNVFEWHKKYTDFQQASTLIYTCSGRVLSLGMIQYTFTGEEHHVSPHKHPQSGKKFVPTAPSTKATLVEEAAASKGPSRIFDETSVKVGGVLD